MPCSTWLINHKMGETNKRRKLNHISSSSVATTKNDIEGANGDGMDTDAASDGAARDVNMKLAKKMNYKPFANAEELLDALKSGNSTLQLDGALWMQIGLTR